MRQEEFRDITKLISNYWGETFDGKKESDWYDIFRDFKPKGLYQTVQELAKEQKFSPRISDIIGKYNELRNNQMREIRERQAEQTKAMAEGQAKCELCKNSGWCQVELEGYTYSVRCVCSHGRDLNKFSHPQIDIRAKSMSNSGKEENLYIPTVKEVLTEESFAIYRAEKMARAREKREKVEVRI